MSLDAADLLLEETFGGLAQAVPSQEAEHLAVITSFAEDCRGYAKGTVAHIRLPRVDELADLLRSRALQGKRSGDRISLGEPSQLVEAESAGSHIPALKHLAHEAAVRACRHETRRQDIGHLFHLLAEALFGKPGLLQKPRNDNLLLRFRKRIAESVELLKQTADEVHQVHKRPGMLPLAQPQGDPLEDEVEMLKHHFVVLGVLENLHEGRDPTLSTFHRTHFAREQRLRHVRVEEFDPIRPQFFILRHTDILGRLSPLVPRIRTHPPGLSSRLK
mmetsp:Transcript_14951/g.56770  ORF Transcript_14951/g.56770 Transcript_14951/m.56770 type:complete len:275 (+) Transcript_14951:666-1490(+)